MTITQRIDLDRVNQRAREVRPGAAIVTIIGTFFWVLGWVIAKTVGGLWFAFAWTGAAIAEGFEQGFKDTAWGKARALRAEAARLSSRG